MAVREGKKYKLEKSENFDEYMKELGEFYILVVLFLQFKSEQCPFRIPR